MRSLSSCFIYFVLAPSSALAAYAMIYGFIVYKEIKVYDNEVSGAGLTSPKKGNVIEKSLDKLKETSTNIEEPASLIRILRKLLMPSMIRILRNQQSEAAKDDFMCHFQNTPFRRGAPPCMSFQFCSESFQEEMSIKNFIPCVLNS
ncbi:hypothetical protein Dimus_036677 [Dionaea muscipula]